MKTHGGEWSVSGSGHFTPRKQTLMDRRLGGPQSLDTVAMKKIRALAGNQTPAM
jgi:hypothetical protein